MTDFVTLVRVKAVESAGERWIEGYATTVQEDRQGDIVEPKGAKFQLPIPLLFQHKHDQPIGAITQATVSEKGIRIRARISAGVVRADEVWQLVKDGVLTAVSIGFRVLKQEPLNSGGYRFTAWEWLECSVVSVPANPGAQISVAKCMAVDVKELRDGQETRPVKYILKDRNVGIPTKGGIDANAIIDKAQDLAKKSLKDLWKKAPLELPQRAYLLAKLGNSIATLTLGRVVDLERRIDALEGYPPADADSFEELAKCMERLDKVEADLADTGFRYRGYWRDGKRSLKSEAYTHNGSLFLCMRSTEDTPDSGSPDWCVIARKGRDARNER